MHKMNWLDPKDVEGWLANGPYSTMYALEQFVRALAAHNLPPDNFVQPNERLVLQDVLNVARLLVKALNGDENDR